MSVFSLQKEVSSNKVAVIPPTNSPSAHAKSQVVSSPAGSSPPALVELTGQAVQVPFDTCSFAAQKPVSMQMHTWEAVCLHSVGLSESELNQPSPPLARRVQYGATVAWS